MDESLAREIHEGLRNTRLTELRDALYAAAARYARLRADWRLASAEDRIRIDEPRRIAHNALIDACDILSRNMAAAGEDIAWRKALSGDRMEIGDFACHLHCWLGIEAR